MLKIGEVARRAGVPIDTVRYYERRGLLPEAQRRASGYREFTPATIDRIRFAKDLQSLGFTLDDIVEMLDDVDAGTADCEREQGRFQQVLGRVESKIRSLQSLRRRLLTTLRRCRDGLCILQERPPVAPLAATRSRRPGVRGAAVGNRKFPGGTI